MVGYNATTGAAVRLQDVASVIDSTSNLYTSGLANGKPAVLIIIFKIAGANVIQTVDRIKAALPSLEASISPLIHTSIVMDRTVTIRAAIHDVEITLLISIVLVIIVVFIFLRDAWATIIPSVAVPLSLVGTFGVMYLLGYTMDNLSLMALTISTGFVVDDAIVVLENITRYLEQGMTPFDAAMKGSNEIGFTVLSMSTSLIAVFIPILLMGGIVGRLFREFAVTLSVAIAVSLVVSLTTTPMMCAQFLRQHNPSDRSRAYRFGERVFNGLLAGYDRGLRWVLRHQNLVLLITVGTLALNIYLYIIVPKGFFPAGRYRPPGRRGPRIAGHLLRRHEREADAARGHRAERPRRGLRAGLCRQRRWWRDHECRPHVHLPQAPSERNVSADQIINRLRGKLSKHSRRAVVSAVIAGHPCRRPRERRRVSVHARKIPISTN